MGSYQVQPGDTLQSIARNAYGDSSLWWKVAQANGISGNSQIRVGQTLSIPSTAAGGQNNVGTFRPFEAGTMVGETTPNLPMPEGDDCGGFGQLLVVIVAVAVAVATQQYYFMGEITAFSAAASAVAGDIAGQVFGVVTGIQDEFHWEQVALAAVGGAVSGGLTAAANAASAGSLLKNVFVRAAISNAISQTIGVVTGLQKEFKWQGVVASAAGAWIGEQVGKALTVDALEAIPGTAGSEGGVQFRTAKGVESVFQSQMGKFAGDITRASLSGLAGGLTTAVLRGGKFSAQRVATDVFGNALASVGMESLGGGNQANEMDRESDRFRPAMAYFYRNGMDVDSDLAEEAHRAQARRHANERTPLNRAEGMLGSTPDPEVDKAWLKATAPYASGAGPGTANRLDPQQVVARFTRGTTSLLTSSQHGITADLTRVQVEEVARLRAEGLNDMSATLRTVAEDPALRGALMKLAGEYFERDGINQRLMKTHVNTAVGLMNEGSANDVAVAANVATSLNNIRGNPFAVAAFVATLSSTKETAAFTVNYLAESSALEYNGGKAWNFATARDIASGFVGGLAHFTGVGAKIVGNEWNKLVRATPDVRANPFLSDHARSVGAPVRSGAQWPPVLTKGKLEPKEAAFSEEILDFRGGHFVGAPKRSFPGIDGTLDGRAVSLKETDGGLASVLKHASKAEDQARNAGYTNVDVYIKAPKVAADSLTDFSKKGGLGEIPQQGVVSNIYVKTKDGWVKIGH